MDIQYICLASSTGITVERCLGCLVLGFLCLREVELRGGMGREGRSCMQRGYKYLPIIIVMFLLLVKVSPPGWG